MTYRRCRPRTSSSRLVRAPVIRNTWLLPPPCCFRITFHHPPASDCPRPPCPVRPRSGDGARTPPTLRRACAAYETGSPPAWPNGLSRRAYSCTRRAPYGARADTGRNAHVEPYEEAAMGWLWAIIVGFVLGLI